MIEITGVLLKDTLVFAAMIVARIGIPFVVLIELGRLVDRWTGAPEGEGEHVFVVETPVNGAVVRQVTK